MLRVEGVFPSACRLWDTPGVKHHYQLSSKLNPDEVLLPASVCLSRWRFVCYSQQGLNGLLCLQACCTLHELSVYPSTN